MSERPELSVVVTVVAGAEAVRRTLAALCPEGRAPKGVEVLVPIEHGQDAVGVLAVEFEDVLFPDLGDLALEIAAPGPLQEHERYDRRRSAGLLLARGSIIAVVEDQGTPAPDFCAAVLAAHRRLPHAAIGGVVSNGVPRAMNDALWLHDFGRYAPPQSEGPREALTDVCVSYKRDALRPIEHVYADRFHEPALHGALKARGGTLWLDPKIAVVEERPRAPFGARLAERFAWGRVYGEGLAAGAPLTTRLLRAAASAVVVPFLLFGRVAARGASRLSALRYLAALPAAAACVVAWSFGEARGILGAKGPGAG